VVKYDHVTEAGISTGYGLHDWSSIPDRATNSFLLYSVKYGSWVIYPPLQWEQGTLPARVKQQKLKAELTITFPPSLQKFSWRGVQRVK
jgi:hypothetical protein